MKSLKEISASLKIAKGKVNNSSIKNKNGSIIKTTEFNESIMEFNLLIRKKFLKISSKCLKMP